MLAILQFLDNGGQEIPLAAALKSAMGGLTDEDLAAIRLSAKKDENGEEGFAAACERLAYAPHAASSASRRVPSSAAPAW